MRIEVELPESAVAGQHGVYITRDGAGDILYIGRTSNLYLRLRGHRSTSTWFRQMRSVEFIPCDGANEARLLEKMTIAQHLPAANLVDRQEPQRGYRHNLPDWTVAKLVTLFEACEDAGKRHNAAENERLNNYILALRNAGWTLQALGYGLSMSREAIRLREKRATRPDDGGLGIPAIPIKTVPAKKVKPFIPAGTLAVMLELKALAQRVNGPTPLDSPLRRASERYSEMIAEQHLLGVSMYRIAKQLGVTPLAIRARLARHGYTEEVKGLPSNIKYGERTWRNGPQSHCMKGHPLSGDNLRLIKGDPKRRVCIECDRRRAREYHARKRVAS